MRRSSPAGVVTPLLVTLLLAALLLAGCAGTSALLQHAGPGKPDPRAVRAYLGRLSAEQARLARAERALPSRPRTPAALSRSIGLLARAIHHLASGLAAIHPPATIARLHRRLVAIARRYHDRLAGLAAQARRPEREVAAAHALARATGSASAAFTSTFTEIRRRLIG